MPSTRVRGTGRRRPSDHRSLPADTPGAPTDERRAPSAARPAPSPPLSLARLAVGDLWSCRDTPPGREELVRRFLPLARRLASRYRSPHEPFDDLVQVASVGLLGAIDRFDPERGISFQSYAIPTILGELKRHFRNTGWSAHVPRGAQQIALSVDQAIRALTAETGRPPRIEAIADHLGTTTEQVLLGMEAGTAHYATSLDAPTRGADREESVTLADSLGNDDQRLGLLETALSLKAAITQLPHLERQALTLRLEQDTRQIEIAEQMGCSQMQVSRLLRRAATRLRALTDPPLPVTRVELR